MNNKKKIRWILKTKTWVSCFKTLTEFITFLSIIIIIIRVIDIIVSVWPWRRDNLAWQRDDEQLTRWLSEWRETKASRNTIINGPTRFSNPRVSHKYLTTVELKDREKNVHRSLCNLAWHENQFPPHKNISSVVVG